MKRIIFVGMHNKEGMKPLDSHTKTGKIIDAVILKIKAECVKSNLCNTDYFVDDSYELLLQNKEWLERIEPSNEDIVITLGQWVYDNLQRGDFKIIRSKHPASLFGVSKVEEYKSYILNKLSDYL